MNVLANWKGGKLLYQIYGGIGDLLWRTALFRQIKKSFPNTYLCVSSRGPHWKLIYENNPHVDELLDFGSYDCSEFDRVIEDELCPHVRCGYAFKMHAVEALGVWAGLAIEDLSYEYKVKDEERKWAKEFLSQFARPIITVALRASSNVRNWDPIQQLRLIKMLREVGTVILLHSHPVDLARLDGVVSMCGGYNVRQVAAVVEQCDLLITPDTGALHFGCHFGIPTVAYFAGTDPKCRIRKTDKNVSVIMQPILPDCHPCWFHGANCPRFGTSIPKCISLLKAEQVFELALQKLKERR